MYDFHTNTQDTIAAVASPIGKGAISIIRISGNQCLPILSKIFRPSPGSASFSAGSFGSPDEGKPLKPGISVGNIIFKRKIIDQVVVWINRGKKSYTGEDLVEINCHGNPLLTNLILDIIISKGARLALPGEFTLRAFLNNKIDLLQAESINDLVNASSYSLAELSVKNLMGKLSKKIEDLGRLLKDILIQIEVAIDHSDDEFVPIKSKVIHDQINHISGEVAKLIDSYDIGKDIKEGISIAIVGKANAGKSSLFNLLIKRDKAIISHIAGTTRDTVEEYLELNNFPIKLIDTAGIKKRAGYIEHEAIKRTLQAIAHSNILLILFDNATELSQHDLWLAEELKKAEAHKFLVINKCDLPSKTDIIKIRALFKNIKMIRISVSRETGIKKIEEAISQYIEKFDMKDKLIINNIRHKNILIIVQEHLQNVLKSILNNLYYDIIGADLKKAIDELGQLIGTYPSEKMLKEIFSNFCIGK
ncbi:MAG: tRNA uridine-5-carboxymethylaminomethyl(34) synthesis GTPase MnmE [Spirochaetes bacterium]|nr:tRNA uridine-5-carboxymethylaminomethyl(34) synthesis GTPase MnmE [Spirochaetota bacterium]